ncbi:MAG: hypothetical protein Q9227_002534 [Pyrenula ochraceoflavens]
MPPRLRLFTSGTLPVRVKQPYLSNITARSITANDKPLPTADQTKGPNQDQAPHVSEEAAAMGKTTGEGGPELDQGTPVQERDKDSQENAPQVMKDEAKSKTPSSQSSTHSGTRSFSTSTRRHAQETQSSATHLSSIADIADIDTDITKFKPKKDERPRSTLLEDIAALNRASKEALLPTEVASLDDDSKGVKFGMPTLSTEKRQTYKGEWIEVPSKSNRFKERYDPVINQLTKLMMVDGKLSLAQKAGSD